MNPAPSWITNTTTYVIAGIVTWRAVRYKINLSHEASSRKLAFLLSSVLLAFIELIPVFLEISTTSSQCQGMILHSVGNIPHIHQSMNDVPSNTSTARLLKIPNLGRTKRSPVQMENGAMPSIFTTSQFAVRSCSDLVHLTDSLQASGRNVLVN